MRHPRGTIAGAVGCVAATAALVAGVLAPAEAIWVLPSRAPTTSATGDQNGCIAEALPMRVVGTGGNRHLELNLQTTCPASADVGWMSFRGSLIEVMPDGTRRTEISPTLIARVQSTVAASEPSRAGWLRLCSDPAFRGTHQWLLRGTLKTRHTARDTDPYTAKVHRLQTVTC